MMASKIKTFKTYIFKFSAILLKGKYSVEWNLCCKTRNTSRKLNKIEFFKNIENAEAREPNVNLKQTTFCQLSSTLPRSSSAHAQIQIFKCWLNVQLFNSNRKYKKWTGRIKIKKNFLKSFLWMETFLLQQCGLNKFWVLEIMLTAFWVGPKRWKYF